MTTHLVDVDKTVNYYQGNPKGYSGIDNPDRYTGNIGYRTQIDDKKNKNTKEKAKNMSKTDLTIILWVNSGC